MYGGFYYSLFFFKNQSVPATAKVIHATKTALTTAAVIRNVSVAVRVQVARNVQHVLTSSMRAVAMLSVHVEHTRLDSVHHYWGLSYIKPYSVYHVWSKSLIEEDLFSFCRSTKQ